MSYRRVLCARPCTILLSLCLFSLVAPAQNAQNQNDGGQQLFLQPANPVILKGLPLSFRGFVTSGKDDKLRDITRKITSWTSTNPAVASIDSTGSALALSAGTTTITASRGHRAASTVLTVTIALPPVFVTQPTDTGVSVVINSPTGVKLQILDNLGGPLAGQTLNMVIGANPLGKGVLSGTRSMNTDAAGVAVFPDLQIDWLGNGYTLVASASPVSGPVSTASAQFNELRVGDPCLGPDAACASGCPNASGDGLNDAWKIAGGIDYNGDGKIDAQHDLLLPGADPKKPDIYVRYDWMDYSTPGNACKVNADCTVFGGGRAGETCTGPQVLPTAPASCVFACSTDTQCTSRGASHIGERCVANACRHTHDPEIEKPGAIQAVVDKFAERGFNLHVVRGQALPHSLVLSFRQLNQVDNSCEGGSVATGTAGAGKYVESFYDLKAGSFDPKQNPVYHYSIFGHYNTCDSTAHCYVCPPVLNPNFSVPPFGSSGIAEINGNDFMVSFGNAVNDRSLRPTVLNLGGTFMHELGHNLGLRHGGGSDFNADAEDSPTFKPNFLSVMNYNFQVAGIQSAAAIGSIVPASSRLDYSTQTLPTGGNTPGALTEGGPGLNEPAGLGSGTADITFFDDGACNFGYQPTNGPLDFDGDGDTTGTNVSVDLNRLDHPAVWACPSGVTETLNGHTDWGPAPGQSIFNYTFQCTPLYADPAVKAQLLGQNVPAQLLTQTLPAHPLAQNELTAEMAEQMHVLYPILPIKIAIQPGCALKAIAPGQIGTVKVALLGSGDFDVSEVELTSLKFHGAKPVNTVIKDMNGDGIPDLLLEFSAFDVRLSRSATRAHLAGWLKSGQAFVGEDEVTVVPIMTNQDCH